MKKCNEITELMLIRAAAQRDSYVPKAANSGLMWFSQLIKSFEHFSPELLSSLCDCGKLLSELIAYMCTYMSA